jgi:hypothetical protein
MLRLLKWIVILILVVVVYSTITGTFRQIYSWMYP